MHTTGPLLRRATTVLTPPPLTLRRAYADARETDNFLARIKREKLEEKKCFKNDKLEGTKLESKVFVAKVEESKKLESFKRESTTIFPQQRRSLSTLAFCTDMSNTTTMSATRPLLRHATAITITGGFGTMRRTYIECGGFSSQLQKKDVVTKSEDPENVVSQTSELFVTKSEWEKYLKRQGLEGTGPDGSDPTVDYMANLWYKYIKYKGYEGTKDELEDFYRWHKQGELWVEHTRDTWERIQKGVDARRANLADQAAYRKARTAENEKSWWSRTFGWLKD